MKTFSSGRQISVPGRQEFDKASATVMYVGEALPGIGNGDNAWLIKRITFDVDGNALNIKWAENGLPTAIWNDRASLGYT